MGDVDATGNDEGLASRLKTWAGPGLVADFRPEAERPLRMVEGAHGVGGFEIPFLPEPFGEDASGSTRGEGHRERLHREMLRMVHGLHVPETWRGPAWERPHAFTTFDLRLVSRPGKNGPGRVRIFLLIKAFAPFDGGLSTDQSRLLAAERALAARRHCRAVAPRSLTLRPIAWRGSDEGTGNEAVAVTDADLGLLGDEPAIGELRRKNILTIAQQPGRHADFGEALARDGDHAVLAVPSPWPLSAHDLLATCSVMSGAEAAMVLSIRLHPTLRTRHEHQALLNLRGRLGRAQKVKGAGSKVRLERTKTLVQAMVGTRDVFHSSIQVAGQDQGAVEEVLTTLAAEQVVGKAGGKGKSGSRPVRVHCLDDRELAIARFNLRNLELWPWGGLNGEVREASRPSGAMIPGAPDLGTFAPPEELLDPDVFLRRDLEHDPRLSRIRSLLSIREAAGPWRLPIVDPGGQAGLASRFTNPFEQLPVETPPGPDMIDLGLVRHRGVTTTQVYRVPLTGHRRGQAGIGDRVTVVAGSPGAGKTNFVLSYLEQLWDTRPESASTRRVPYLVIDPTRGQEFRWLLEPARDDLLVFTVGDARGVPFCFNPFIVPENVSTLVHISRLMSPFRAAYSMWDPLPAIFEAAIRLAYKKKYEQIGKAWDPVSDFGTGRAEDYPTLSDVCDAMGTGKAGETGTVLSEQRDMWSADGQGTENQATIIASTSLRLRNLRDNYDHVIGGPAPGRDCVDLRKLLRVPTVLELGMIGDTQALSLVMGFLVVSLAGCIENRNRDRDGIHCLVIEEAHRLLSAEGGSNQEGASSRLQAAEEINNLLAEVRKYGQGVILLDQRPGSLVGGVIDNAYLVALHRLNEQKSFGQFAAMLNLTPQQQRFALVGLEPGEAVILDRPSGVPVIIQPHERKKEKGRRTDAWLAGGLKDLVRAVHFDRKHLILERCLELPDPRGTLATLRALVAEGPASPNLAKIDRLARGLVERLDVPASSRKAARIALVKELAIEAGYTPEEVARLVRSLASKSDEASPTRPTDPEL